MKKGGRKIDLDLEDKITGIFIIILYFVSFYIRYSEYLSKNAFKSLKIPKPLKINFTNRESEMKSQIDKLKEKLNAEEYKDTYSYFKEGGISHICIANNRNTRCSEGNNISVENIKKLIEILKECGLTLKYEGEILNIYDDDKMSMYLYKNNLITGDGPFHSEHVLYPIENHIDDYKLDNNNKNVKYSPGEVMRDINLQGYHGARLYTKDEYRKCRGSWLDGVIDSINYESRNCKKCCMEISKI